MDTTKQASLKVLDVSVQEIEPNQNNPNEMSDEAFSRLVEEIKEVGFLVPIIVFEYQPNKFRILNGEHRWRAAIQAGYEFIPSVIISDEKFNDPDLFELVNIRLNEIRGKINPIKMQPIYDRVVEKFGEDNAKKVLGITTEEVYKKLIKKMSISFKKQIQTKDGVEKIDKAASKHRDPKSFSRAVMRILREESQRQEASNVIIIQSIGRDSIVVKADDQTFAVFSEISRMCQLHSIDINSLLFPGLAEILSKSNQMFNAEEEGGRDSSVSPALDNCLE